MVNNYDKFPLPRIYLGTPTNWRTQESDYYSYRAKNNDKETHDSNKSIKFSFDNYNSLTISIDVDNSKIMISPDISDSLSCRNFSTFHSILKFNKIDF